MIQKLEDLLIDAKKTTSYRKTQLTKVFADGYNKVLTRNSARTLIEIMLMLFALFAAS